MRGTWHQTLLLRSRNTGFAAIECCLHQLIVGISDHEQNRFLGTQVAVGQLEEKARGPGTLVRSMTGLADLGPVPFPWRVFFTIVIFILFRAGASAHLGQGPCPLRVVSIVFRLVFGIISFSSEAAPHLSGCTKEHRLGCAKAADIGPVPFIGLLSPDM